MSPPELQRHPSPPPGLTLLEILVAIVVVAVGTASYMAVQQNSWWSIGRSNKTLIAGKMIESRIEEIRAHVARDPQSNFPALSGGSTTRSGIHLTWSFANATFKGVAVNDVKRVAFEATWDIPRRDTLTVVTYVSEDF